MDAYYVKVIYSDKVSFNNFVHYENNELAISSSGRLVHVTNCALLETEELANHYKNAIQSRRMKDGDTAFDAIVMKTSSHYPNFTETVKKDTGVVIAKLEKWKYPTPETTKITQGGWIIHLKIEDKAQDLYLLKFGSSSSISVTNSKNLAKKYKKLHFVQKVLEELKQVQKIRAVAVEI